MLLGFLVHFRFNILTCFCSNSASYTCWQYKVFYVFLFCSLRLEMSTANWSPLTFYSSWRQKSLSKHWTGHIKCLPLFCFHNETFRFLVYNVGWVDWAIGVSAGEKWLPGRKGKARNGSKKCPQANFLYIFIQNRPLIKSLNHSVQRVLVYPCNKLIYVY